MAARGRPPTAVPPPSRQDPDGGNITHLSADDFAVARPSPAVPGQPLGRRSRTTSPVVRRSVRLALAMAAPQLVVVTMAMLPWLLQGFIGPRAGAVGIAAVVVAPLAGYILADTLGLTAWRGIWLINLCAAALLLPLLALQATLARTPFVSPAYDSAAPLVWVTAGTLLALIGLACLAAILTIDAPEEASLVFTPIALLTPAVIAAPGNLGTRSALAALAEAMLLSAAVVAVGWLLPRGLRPLVGAAALGAQFVLLWLLSYEPAFHPTRGAIVPTLSAIIIGGTVLLTVVVPLLAVWLRRAAREMRDEVNELD